MTLETKKTIGIVGSGLAAMVAVSGIILMSTQIKVHGAGFFVGYVFYALVSLAVGMWITWLPKMENHKWGFKKVEGHLKWTKNNNNVDVKRTRLVFWPLITIFFELFGIFTYCNDLWPSEKYEALTYVFNFLIVIMIIAWAITTAKKKETQV